MSLTNDPVWGSVTQIGDLIKRRRLELGLTQDDLEARSDFKLSQNYISQVELGEIARPREPRLRIFAEALDIPIDDLKVAMGWVVQTPPTGGGDDASDPRTIRFADNSHLLTAEDWEEIEQMLERRRRERKDHE